MTDVRAAPVPYANIHLDVTETLAQIDSYMGYSG